MWIYRIPTSLRCKRFDRHIVAIRVGIRYIGSRRKSLTSVAVHVFFASIAVRSWLLTVLSSLVLLVTAGVQALRRRLVR